MKKEPRPKKKALRKMRVFSEAFRRQRVKDIEQKLLTVIETARLYDVSSTAVYNWLHRYSHHLTHQTRHVVELESEQHRTKLLIERMAELERMVGQKQMEIDVLQRTLEIISSESGIDWKKKCDMRFLPGFTAIANSTTTP